MSNRIRHPGFAALRLSAAEAAQRIRHGMTVGMSGFTGAGYPKAIPGALAEHITARHAQGEPFRITVLTGASTAPELDGVLARVDGIELRVPFQSDPELRGRINSGALEYMDIHLGQLAEKVRYGFFGKVDVAVIEISAILEDGRLVPSSSVGNNKTWLDMADAVILEVNRWQPEALEGMHDIYYDGALPPARQPIPLVHPGDRIGEPYLSVPLEKVVAVVETDAPDRNSPFKQPDAASKAIADHLLDFLRFEVKAGRIPGNLLPIQSGVGNIANAFMQGLGESEFTGLTAFTEVIQDGMLELLISGKLALAAATSFSLSPVGIERFNEHAEFLRKRIVLRQQGISNHPELIRRLGCIALNGMLEADIYGNVNSTHTLGTQMMNGIGGSGDFARNAYLSVFMAPSVAKNGLISTLVPMVSHVDHTEHDVSVIVTDQGLADLRMLSPKQRAKAILERCVHPSYRDALGDYIERANRDSFGKHTPHLLAEALSWHERYRLTGSMLNPEAVG
ncbi:acetyl-CoA hydrolase/transferase family protein [Pseudomonas typographi]|uniref:Acetyl-CoA hydrolase/transferase family protein n=1 Tax=Pseudomonas typographi TaxID=2715964 RepID=A0ABR7Z155_9PSED|nr:acetyl-CoA hydrolase/transferase family protein [Pseudomonas typographi]MBD1554611.1 acetyl-CoA hydrolase/transferase family protein [Pseudomonas typographi]MBD1589728.1 acetyl-CoA hydrolase/transferase family protein [Pseudomonas typographi]MBD1599205.1 acetyl-CoA hydrolase/transferase family protein [Pseudomonas typographi]